MDSQSMMTLDQHLASLSIEMTDHTSHETLQDIMAIIHRECPELILSDCQAETFAADLYTKRSNLVKTVAMEEGLCRSRDMMDSTSDGCADVARYYDNNLARHHDNNLTRHYDNNLTTSRECGEMSSLWSPNHELSCLPHERVESVGTGVSLDPVIGVFASLSLECLPQTCR